MQCVSDVGLGLNTTSSLL